MLLQDGRGLFNVSVDDVQTTWTTLPYVRHKQGFGYDFSKDGVFALEGKGNYYWVADYVTTSAEVGKRAAHDFMLAHGWQRYMPPKPRQFPLPTPTPVPTPTPRPTMSVNPEELADASLPLDERVTRQLDMFLLEQSRLSSRLYLERTMKPIDPKLSKKLRLDLLNHQLKVLSDYYPVQEERVKNGIEALKHQIEVVEQTGLFFNEK